MRRTRQIYKRKSRSNMETLIILIGAIIILSVAFYMAREKSFLPPEEIQLEQQDIFEEEVVQNDKTDQKAIEELLAQDSTISIDKEGTSEYEELDQTEISHVQDEVKVSQEEPSIIPKEQVLQNGNSIVESQAVVESAGIEQTLDEIDKITSDLVYTVQVGYFSVESNARSLAKSIEKQGFQAYVLKQNNAYKVQVGAYKDRVQAEKASQELKMLGYEIWVTQR